MVDGIALCVFCGSSQGFEPRFARAAADAGRALAEAGIDLVYGGGHIGLMGVLADAALGAGGRVVGVIPRALMDRELAHGGLSELEIVATMHERKARMAELADAFVALPGGAGTLEEIFEQWTWAQLGIHSKPCGILNLDGYFDPLEAMVGRMLAAGFLSSEHAALLTFERELGALLARMHGHDPVEPPGALRTEEGA
jgi:uncharacterized protein (TIGR00730 family)